MQLFAVHTTRPTQIHCTIFILLASNYAIPKSYFSIIFMHSLSQCTLFYEKVSIEETTWKVTRSIVLIEFSNYHFLKGKCISPLFSCRTDGMFMMHLPFIRVIPKAIGRIAVMVLSIWYCLVLFVLGVLLRWFPCPGRWWSFPQHEPEEISEWVECV